MHRRLAAAPPVRDFFAAVARPGPIRLIAEVKKASPSKGVIRADFDPVRIARTYQEHGASASACSPTNRISRAASTICAASARAVDLPLLRKDFIVDPYQVVEARAAGADAVLLIAECLDDPMLRTLHAAVRGLTA